MAKNAKNIVIHGITGKLGNQLVFRQKGDNTIIATKPGKRTSEPTQAELDHRLHFQEAILYGQKVNADPALKENYKSKAGNGTSAYNVAVADFLKAPHIDEIDVSKYTGQPGGTIRIRAIDDFKVSKITVTIKATGGTTLESGNAQEQPDSLDWLYTATKVNPGPQGTIFIIAASDIPGNVTQTTKTS